MADQVCLLAMARLSQIADPRTLYEEPATRFAPTPSSSVAAIASRESAHGDRFVVEGVGAFTAAISPRSPMARRPSSRSGRSASPSRPSRVPIGSRDRRRHCLSRLRAEARLRLAGGREIHARLSAAHDIITGLQPGATVHVGWPADKARVLT